MCVGIENSPLCEICLKQEVFCPQFGHDKLRGMETLEGIF